MSIRELSRNPVLRREMDVRASGDDGYRVFNYTGPGLYLLLLQIPVLYAAMGLSLGIGWRHDASSGPALFLVTVWLQIVYFSHAAARFSAGSVAVERERGTIDALRLVPRPSRDLFAGKYLASIAPLLVEAVVAVPFLSLYAAFGSVSLVSVLLSGLLNVALILFFGMVGMFWSLHSRDVLSAVSHAFLTVLALNMLPLVLGTFLHLSQDATCRPLFLMSPLYVGMTLVHAGHVSMMTAAHDVGLLALCAGLSAALALLMYRASLRRLSGR